MLMKIPGRGEALSLALVGVLGAGCANANAQADIMPSPEKSCLSLTAFDLAGGMISGGESAMNAGDCVTIYNTDTLKNIGNIAAGPDGNSVIVCSTSEPAEFYVRTMHAEVVVVLESR